ncbi:MAG: fibronectin type III domain-containing protein [Spirochaetales bacterium]|nr:fibronectin type III domain-containing protein [Spirochaetales bacterium]
MSKSVILFFLAATLVLIMTGCPPADQGGGIITVDNVEITAITANTTSITVTWTDPAGSGLDRIEAECSDGTKADVVPGTQTCTFTGLDADNDYTISLISVSTTETPSDGNYIIVTTTTSGSSNHTPISTAAEFDNIRNDRGGEYLLTSDIDLSAYQAGSGWVPLADTSTRFTGIVNGNGHSITGLVIDNPSTSFMGLFGVADSGNICNINIVSASVTGNTSVGSFIGYMGNSSKIAYCSFSGTVTGTGSRVGGIAGYNDTSTVTGCFSSGTIAGSSNDNGGIVGYNDTGTVTLSFSTCTVDGVSTVGGLVGNNVFGTVTDSYASGPVTCSGQSIGRLIGASNGPVQNCYATGSVTAGTSYAGGLVGRNENEINTSYATGTVSGENYAGGLVGSISGASSTVINSYARGSVTASLDYAGGLAGGISAHGTITNVYSTGLVDCSGTNAGGLLGDNSISTVTGSYWDTETSGMATSDGGTGLTTAEMKEQTNYTGWNFTDIWAIAGSTNSGYPYLQE